MIAFFHFGINTFEEYVNEGDGRAPAAIFRSETISEEDPVTQFKFDAGQPVGYFNTEQSAQQPPLMLLLYQPSRFLVMTCTCCC